MAVYGWQGTPRRNEGTDPFAAARARLAARLEREQSLRPDVPGLDELIAEIGELHPLPAVATKILQIGDDQRFSAHELATIIASDQVLTSRILRLANSAFYGAPRRIGTVRDAVVLLGFRAVHQVALASCVMASPARLTNMRYEDFWQFSITTGLLCELLARTEGAHEDASFTAGVMHNVGLLALDQHRPDLLRETLVRARERGETLHQAQRAVLGFVDTDLGGALATHWNFPPELAEAVRDHSAPLDEQAHGTLAGVVARARIFARSYGMSDGLQDRPDPVTRAPEWEQAPLSVTLERAGGIDQIVERASAFLEAALG